MTADLVSIVIPVYNGVKFLRESVLCALGQTYKDIEVILVDDGSSDGTRECSLQLQQSDPRIRLFTIRNSGVTAARKIGVDNASGKWICFLDVDDSLPVNAIETFSNQFITDADILASGEPSLTLEEYKCGLMRRKSHPELWGKLFRTEFIRAYYPTLDRSIIIGEDQTINLVLANNAKKLVTIPELLYRYNLSNPESVTKRFRHTAEYEIMFQKLFNRLVRISFNPDSDTLQSAEYKMKIEGFKMVVLDGNRFDPKCKEWVDIIDYYSNYPKQLAVSEKLLIRLARWQGMYFWIMKIVLSLHNIG